MSRTFQAHTIEQFESYLKRTKVYRTIDHLQVQHTEIPRHDHYIGENTLISMWRNHTRPEPHGRGWDDIGYHIVIAPDGVIWTARSFESECPGISQASHKGLVFCVLGNFDIGEDILSGMQLYATVAALALTAKIFSIDISTTITCIGTSVNREQFLERVKEATLRDIIPTWKLAGLEYLREQNIFPDFDFWKDRIDASMPVWAITILIKRLHRELMELKEIK